MQLFQKRLSTCPHACFQNLTSLSMNHFSSKDNLFEILMYSPKLISLDLSQNKIRSSAVPSPLSVLPHIALQNLTNLTFLDLGFVQIPEAKPRIRPEDSTWADFEYRPHPIGYLTTDLTKIIIVVKNFKKLKYLNISEHDALKNSVFEIVDLIKTHETLEILKISDYELNPDLSRQILKSVKLNSTLKELNMTSCQFDDETFEELEELEKVNKTVKIITRRYQNKIKVQS